MNEIQLELNRYSNTDEIEKFKRFHKTGKGEYAENDIFLGINVPSIRKVAKKYFKDITANEISKLMHSKYHEYRLTALIILTYQFKKADKVKQKDLVKFYIDNAEFINGWDLVDLSSYHILGQYLTEHKEDTDILYNLVKSDSMWEQRIAIVSTYAFIKNNQFEHTLNLAKMLISNKNDLIHKAVGWMLREIGKRDFDIECNFLVQNYSCMPRTMLRYSIEKFPEDLRQKFLSNRFVQ